MSGTIFIPSLATFAFVRGHAVVVGILFAILSGCVAHSPSQGAGVTATSESSRPVVVALLDSGVNPYQPIFHTTEPIDFAAYPIAERLRVSLGVHPDEGRKADAAIWERFELRRLYGIEGTRLLAISFSEDGKEHPIDYAAHGAGTSYIVARDAPNAVIVMVQVRAGRCAFDERGCSEDPTEQDPSIADGMEWIAEQPWIDVVSVSIGTEGNIPDTGAQHPESARFVAASRRAAESGKVLVFAAGNAPTPPISNPFAGVPWGIAVGGYEPTSGGQQTLLAAASGFDVLANYTEYIGNFHEMGTFTGTSYAAPNVAATIAGAMHEVRRAGVTTDAISIRKALNASASLLDPQAWDPTAPNNRTFPDSLTTQLSAPAILPTQQGWGYVNASLAPEIARRLLEQDFALAAEKSNIAAYQERYQAAREQYWSNPP